ncbi:MAG TPA: ATP-binding cassette domain-containing protein [Kofleriaceae bacterium]
MRRRLVPEVIQTSGMDCGPACLASLLGGFGIQASYGRLREACHTDVDGTSIDTIEDIALELGLDAQQVLVPLEHVAMPELPLGPAIALTQVPGGGPHFVVLWNAMLGRAQVMDPARGRRWLSAPALERELYVHEMNLPAATWRAWAGGELCASLAVRLNRLRVRDAGSHVERALADPGWRSLAVLDAATRMATAMVASDGMLAGEAERMIDALLARPDSIPAVYWHARACESEAEVRVRGAVVLRIAGVSRARPASRDLARTLGEPQPRPWRAVFAAMCAGGAWRPAVLAGVTAVAAVGVVVEAMLFRAMFDLGGDLTSATQLAGALAALVAFLVALWLVEVPLRAESLRLGRQTEVALRATLLAKLPRLGLRYLRSRAVSDLAERGHMLHRLRELPALGARVVRAQCQLIATAVALIWIAPGAAPLVIALAIASTLLPMLALQTMTERELRMRTHDGALAGFYLDALIGTVPARATGIEPALRSEHEGLLVEWTGAARARHRFAIAITALQAVAGFGLGIAIVYAGAREGSPPASLMLLAYWALAMPATGEALAAAVREIPSHVTSTLRYLEPLGAASEEAEIARAPAEHGRGVAIQLEHVSVVAGGHTILEDVELSIGAGEHVAVVGLSGGGKSTLLGLLLGWSRPAAGIVRVDGSELDAAGIAALRARSVWIDPEVTLWNDSIAANLSYGASDADVARVVAEAELEPTIARMPEGLATRLGEGGGLVSGGEGQRIRIGRGLTRRAPALVILDEPCRGLDRETRRRLLAKIRARWRDATLLCATHDIADTADLPRVVVVEHGRVVEDGSPQELARRSSRYAALLADEHRAARAWSTWRRVRLADGRIEREPEDSAR